MVEQECKDPLDAAILEEQNAKLESEKANVPEGEPISGFVNQDLVQSLIQMGFSKNVAEKSLFLNQNILEKSIEWIYENQDQPDFEEELRMIGKEQKSNMTPEEIKAKAKELQEYARKRFLQKEKERAEEQERTRIRMSKSFYITY